jgi:hypothetical protein
MQKYAVFAERYTMSEQLDRLKRFIETLDDAIVLKITVAAETFTLAASEVRQVLGVPKRVVIAPPPISPPAQPNQPPQPPPAPPGPSDTFFVRSAAGVNVRKTPDVPAGNPRANIIMTIPDGTELKVKGEFSGSNLLWTQITGVANPEFQAVVNGFVAKDFLSNSKPVPASKRAVRGVNLNLDLETTSPADLRPMSFCRFVYDVSQERGNLDLNVIRPKYDAKINNYIAQGVTPIAILNHETYGEGRGFAFDRMSDADWGRFIEEYTPFIRQIAGVYGTKFVYQIWNEADQASVAAVGLPARHYARMLDAAIDAIRGVVPAAKIITSGLVSGDVNYWRTTWANLRNKGRLDGLALHAYGRRPSDGRDYRATLGADFGTIRGLVDAYFPIAQLPIWFTEWGVTGDPAFNRPPNVPEVRVIEYIQAFLNEVHGDTRIAAAAYFAYADGMHNTFGLANERGVPKSAVYRAAAEA